MKVSHPQPSNFAARELFKLAVLIVVVWWLFLGGMALFTANPITLNREQILRAEIVVTAKVVNPDQGSIVIEKTWKKNGDRDSITLENLMQASAKTNVSYIIPITLSQNGRYNVTNTRLPNNPPLIYPNTPEAARQLQAILEKE